VVHRQENLVTIEELETIYSWIRYAYLLGQEMTLKNDRYLFHDGNVDIVLRWTLEKKIVEMICGRCTGGSIDH
jgi:hypothetical protein